MTKKLPKLVKRVPQLGPEAGLYDDGHYYHVPPTDDELLGPDEKDDFYRVVDEASGRIEFRRECPMFRIVRDALASGGVDIEKVETESELDALQSQFGHMICSLIVEKHRNRTPKTLEDALMKALMIGDSAEADRIGALISKKKAMGLKVVGRGHSSR